ncbi:MAG TPA: hypothetical protein VH280_14795 [Verrucomicrobiae bacterium]|nr:hypothetical protein [Verrucomicrobiae bacterium]
MNCPKCSRPLTRHDNVLGNGPPEKGDVTVCLYCATMLIFESPEKLRRIIRSDIEQLSPEEAFALGKAHGLVLKTILEAQ